MIRKFMGLLALGLVAAPIPAAATPPLTGEQQLERELRGRVAGEPTDCIDLLRYETSRVIPNTAIIYEVGDTIYVNRPRSGASSLNRYDAQVTRPFGNRLCNVDPVRMIDARTGMLTGIVTLGDFVPYRRVRDRR